KYSIRLRETNKQIEQLVQSGAFSEPAKDTPATPHAGTLQAEALAYFVSQSTGNVFPVFKSDALIGRFDSVTGMSPEIDLTNEDPDPQHPAPPRPPRHQGRQALRCRGDRDDERHLPERPEARERRAHADQGR